ncbi:MAG: ATP-binding protein [Gemmatimonadales bacterium]
MSNLRLSPDLTLPRDAITQTFGILAKRGVGKTYTSAVITEEMLKTNLPVCVVDPVGVWWGLRASADGKSEGLPIVVMGGEHGDIPLDLAGGSTIADLIVDERISVVLDLSLFRKGEQTRFMTDFAERLYHRNREPLHLVLDEADAFAPQKPMKGQERLLGAIEDLVRRGRARGLGITLVTQRAAVINKDVLTQCEVLVALRTIAPQDRAAVDAWIQVHGTKEQREEMMASLPSLPIGTAWFWSPGWLDIFKRVKIRQRETFDSSRTPKLGEKIRPPKKLAPVDLERLRDRVAATIEKAKADDPKELRRRIQELERAARTQKPAPAAAPAKAQQIEKRVEVPVLKDAQLKRLESVSARLVQFGERAVVLGESVVAVGREITASLAKLHQSAGNGQTRPARPITRTLPAPRAARPQAPAKAPPTGDVQFSKSQGKILDALAQLEQIGIAPVDKTQLALMADQSPTSGGYFNNLGALRSAGLIDYPSGGIVALTDAGRAVADGGNAPSTTEELQQMLFAKLSGSQVKILEVLIECYPDPIEKGELAERSNQSPTSGGYFNNLGRLRSLGLVEYPAPGQVVAQPVLFLEGASR